MGLKKENHVTGRIKRIFMKYERYYRSCCFYSIPCTLFLAVFSYHICNNDVIFLRSPDFLRSEKKNTHTLKVASHRIPRLAFTGYLAKKLGRSRMKSLYFWSTHLKETFSLVKFSGNYSRRF